MWQLSAQLQGCKATDMCAEARGSKREAGADAVCIIAYVFSALVLASPSTNSTGTNTPHWGLLTSTLCRLVYTGDSAVNLFVA